MGRLRSFGCGVGMLSLFLSVTLVAEQGKMMLHVADTEGRPVANLSLSTLGLGGGEQRTDGTGRAILVLPPGTKEKSHIQLQIVRSPKGHDYVLFDPWMGRPVQVPSFENDAMNIVPIVVAERGSLDIVRHPRTLLVQINEANAPKTAGKPAEVSPKEGLDAVSKQYGLAPEEVDKAIREWGKKATDHFDRGQAALYAGRYPDATKELTVSLEAREEELQRDRKKDEDAVVEAASSLGQSLYAQGRYREAAVAYDRALQLRPDDPHLLNAKGSSLLLLGDYAGAEPLYRHALNISEKAVGPDHPDTATSLNNLAVLLKDKGDFVAAEPLFRRARSIDEKTLGLDHPDTATVQANLALLLQEKGDYASAEVLDREALSSREKSIGPNAADTATSLNNLALLLMIKGDNVSAEPLFRRALSIDETALGPDHPGTATDLSNLAFLLQAKKDYAGAKFYDRRALTIREKVLGPSHPDTETSLNNLSEVLIMEGSYAEAEPLVRRALAIAENTLGQYHAKTAVALNNLGQLLYFKGDYAGSEPLVQRALSIDEKTLGVDNPTTKMIRENLAIVRAKLK